MRTGLFFLVTTVGLKSLYTVGASTLSRPLLFSPILERALGSSKHISPSKALLSKFAKEPRLAKMSISRDSSLESIYQDLVSIPTISAGFFVPLGGCSNPAILLQRSHKDLKNDESRQTLTTYFPSGSINVDGIPDYTPQPFATELRDVGMLSPSPSGRYLALVRSRDGKGGQKEQSIEVWEGPALLSTVSAPEDVHGVIYSTADAFGCLEWSPNEDKLLYVAESPRRPKGTSFWAKHTSETPENKDPQQQAQQASGKGKEFAFVEVLPPASCLHCRAGPICFTACLQDWGELSTGRALSRLFVLDIASEKILPGMPDRLLRLIQVNHGLRERREESDQAVAVASACKMFKRDNRSSGIRGSVLLHLPQKRRPGRR